VEIKELRGELQHWFSTRPELKDEFGPRGGVGFEQEIEHQSEFMRVLYDAGWTRYGWSREVGGLGGDEVARAIVYDEVNAAGLVLPEAFVILETIGPPLVRYAPELAARHLDSYLRGDQLWAQGFSEPDAGSDLASLRTRASVDDDGFSLTGQKTWTTLGQCAQWAAVLCRTGEQATGHQGLTMLWVDLSARGVTVRPITAANGRNEFAEMFFDGVRVPSHACIGPVGEGWQVAMFLLQFERGMYAWERQAALHRVLSHAVAMAAEPSPQAVSAVGAAFSALCSLRAKSSSTVQRLAAQEALGAEVSVDKLLLSRAEQLTYDAVRLLDRVGFLLGDQGSDRVSREGWHYSRATSIFGGTAEVQRGILAERVLGLGRRSDRGR
jgi:acyl-CoA dehydrogenase